MNIFKIITFIHLSAFINSHDIEILDSGLARLRRNDMLMRFYVTVQHHGRRPRNIFVHIIECCEYISEDDVDCNSFRLYEDYIRIQPGTIRNLTLFHPNIYVYNRKGSCLLGIWNRLALDEKCDDKPLEIKHRVHFDTFLKSNMHEISPVLRGYYDPKSTIKCETRDLDPFDDCLPVNCHIKYSGARNYFHPKQKRCQKVPLCIGDPRKELADIVYVPSSNMCRDLENMVTEEDTMAIIKGKVAKPDFDLESSSVNIQCHHGEIDTKTGLCICDYGWKSEPFDPDNNNAVYHMCNMQCHRDRNRVPMVPFVIGIIVTLWLSLCICFCEKYHFSYQFMPRVINSPEDDCSCTQYVVDDSQCQ